MKSAISVVGHLAMLAGLCFGFPFEAIANQICRPRHEVIDFKTYGHYHRFHPSGDFAIATEGRTSFIVDLRNRDRATRVSTGWREEAYPVEAADGGWNLIAAPIMRDGGGITGGMHFYSFDESLNSGENARPQFSDREFGQYYHSSAELPGSTKDIKRVRLLLYQDQHYRDYEMKMDESGRIKEAKIIASGHLCSNLFKTNERPKVAIGRYEFQNWRAGRALKELIALPNDAPLETRIEIETRHTRHARAAAELRFGREHGAKATAAANAFHNYQRAKVEFESRPEVMESAEDLRAAETEVKRMIEEKIGEGPDIRRRMNLALEQRNESEYSRLYDLWRNAEQDLSSSRAFQEVSIKRQEAELKVERLKMRHYGKVEAMLVELDRAEGVMSTLRGGISINQPVLSKNGTHLAGSVAGSIQVFKINPDGNCESIAQTGYRGSKASFNYPKQGEPLKIVFTATPVSNGERSQVYVYDVASKETKILDGKVPEETYATYPGFTLDGRVMFSNADRVEIVDPIAASGKGCIKMADAESGSEKSRDRETSR